MKKSAKENILEFFIQNRGVFHNGQLQRMEFKNKNGSLATGDTIKRRLQNLAEENKINVEYRDGHAHYSADAIPQIKKQVIQIIETPEGRVARVMMV